MKCIHIEMGKECNRIVVEGSDFCPQHITAYGNGCTVTNCGKIRTAGSALCAHHKLLEDETPAESSRMATRAAATRTKRQARRDYLKDSPLAALNPNVPEKRSAHLE